MSIASPQEIRKHVKTYMAVFAALAFLTVITVAVAYIDLEIAAAVTLALAIATIKGSLVALFFMHLSTEKRIIISVLILTAALFAVLLLLPAFDKL